MAQGQVRRVRLPILCLCGLLVAIGRAVKPELPGSKTYWVDLQSLDSNAGQVTSKTNEGKTVAGFQGNGTYFDLLVRDEKLDTVTFQIGLHLAKYNLMFCPYVHVDGTKVEVNPLKPIRYQIPLNETIGPFDRTVNIKISDPKGGQFFWNAGNSHTYSIRVRQPPEFDRVVLADSLVVTNSEGVEVEPNHKYKSLSKDVDYHYKLMENETSVTFKLVCNEFSTRTVIDGQDWTRGDPKTVDMSNTLEGRSLVECIYHDPAWTTNNVGHTYVLNFRRHGTLGEMTVMLQVMADYGYCTTEDDYNISLGLGHKSGWQWPVADADNSLVCLTYADKPNFMARYANPQAEVRIMTSSGEHYHMFNLHPVVVTFPKSEGNHANYTLKLRASEDEKEFSIRIIRAALCPSLECPLGWMTKKNILQNEAAAHKMCLSENCTVEHDSKHCCQATPVRTKYVFGEIQSVNNDGTYDVHFDEGGWSSIEVDVHARHIRAIEPLGYRKHEAFIKDSYKVGERVEARISLAEAIDLKNREIAAVGISSREKLVHYAAVGCLPEARKCTIEKQDFSWGDVPQKMPSAADYGDAINDTELCFYDSKCSDVANASGCNANNVEQRCRFCGFGDNTPCPKSYRCNEGNANTWSQGKKDWCCDKYSYGCPWWCRYGKWLPDEGEAWGPWWTKPKQTWCCENQGIGCGSTSKSEEHELLGGKGLLDEWQGDGEVEVQDVTRTTSSIEPYHNNFLWALCGAGALLALTVAPLAWKRRRHTFGNRQHAFKNLNDSGFGEEARAQAQPLGVSTPRGCRDLNLGAECRPWAI